jgi:hypothetical protein
VRDWPHVGPAAITARVQATARKRCRRRMTTGISAEP